MLIMIRWAEAEVEEVEEKLELLSDPSEQWLLARCRRMGEERGRGNIS